MGSTRAAGRKGSIVQIGSEVSFTSRISFVLVLRDVVGFIHGQATVVKRPIAASPRPSTP